MNSISMSVALGEKSAVEREFALTHLARSSVSAKSVFADTNVTSQTLVAQKRLEYVITVDFVSKGVQNLQTTSVIVQLVT